MKIPNSVRKDLNWWHVFAQSFNGVAAIPSLEWSTPDSVFSTDTCLTGGGDWNNRNYFHFQFPQDIIDRPNTSTSSNYTPFL